MTRTNRLEYFVTNNAKDIMNILIKHDILESNPSIFLLSNYLFQY